MVVNRIRKTYLECCEIALDLLKRDEVKQTWAHPSALREWTVGGLAGHLARALTTVKEYLGAELAPTGEARSAAAYYSAAVDTDDLDSELHRGIRQRGEQMASMGYKTLLELEKTVLDELRTTLNEESDSRRVRAHKGIVLFLDDYLITRLVELSVHMDDLALSAGVPTPPLPHAALDIAIDALVSTARHRHGDLAVLRALTRRERDEINALRVL